MASLLCICDQGYRAAVEEQDDTVIWMTHMLQKDENVRTALLLRGTAVNYAHKAQKSVPLSFGDWKQKHPADFPRDLGRYAADGGKLYVLAEDLERYGLGKGDLVEGVTVVNRSGLAGLIAEYDQVSFW